MSIIKDLNSFSSKYSEGSFLDKISKFAKSIGKSFLLKLLTLWFTLKDKDTPMAARSIILGVLGYFIIPIDLVPDIMPFVGFSDDLSALVSASAVIWQYIKPDHLKKAILKLDEFNIR